MADSSQAPRRQRLLVIVGLIFLLLVVAFLYQRNTVGDSCEGIFQQSQLNMNSHIEVLRIKGQIGFANDQIQQLTERAQLAALNYKSCCIAANNGLMAEADFLACKNSATTYESQIQQAANSIEQARSASKENQPAVASEAARSAAEVLKSSELTLQSMPVPAPEAAAAVQPTQNPVPLPVSKTHATTGAVIASGMTESEPNNDLFNSNEVRFGQTVEAALSDNADQDAYVIRNHLPLRDWVSIRFENQSAQTAPQMNFYNSNRQHLSHYYLDTLGADLEFSYVAEPGSNYYLNVNARSGSGGPYRLKLIPLQRYDALEPNDSAFEASEILPGQPVAGSILDAKDKDWFLLSSGGETTVTVALSNRSTTMAPDVNLYNANKSHLVHQYDNTAGADLRFQADIPTASYYIAVSARNGQPGEYSLKVE
jgi:hypothetical protein